MSDFMKEQGSGIQRVQGILSYIQQVCKWGTKSRVMHEVQEYLCISTKEQVTSCEVM